MSAMTIGQLAKSAEVGVETIRFYEREGLIEEPPRRASGYRQYPAETVERVRFIRRAKELGFTLKEIKELLSLRAAPRTRCADVRRRAEAKVRDIDEKVRTLQAMRKALTKLIAECSGQGPVTDCPILEALGSDAEKESSDSGPRCAEAEPENERISAQSRKENTP